MESSLELESGGYQLFSIHTGHQIQRMPEKSPYAKETAQKGGFPHFMLKEIDEQAREKPQPFTSSL